MSNRARFTIQGTGQTTDGTTVTTIVSADISALPGLNINNAGVLLIGTLIGLDGSNNACSGQGARTVKRIAGTLTALGTLATITAFDGDIVGTPVMTIDVTGTTVRLRVTGVAATTINWDGYLDVISGSF